MCSVGGFGFFWYGVSFSVVIGVGFFVEDVFGAVVLGRVVDRGVVFFICLFWRGWYFSLRSFSFSGFCECFGG